MLSSRTGRFRPSSRPSSSTKAWVFLKNHQHSAIRRRGLKTWRKHTRRRWFSPRESLDELKRSEILDVIIESCSTKIFLANPDMDRDLYRRPFHLNESEVEADRKPPPQSKQLLIKTPGTGEGRHTSQWTPKSYCLHERPLRQQETERGIRKPTVSSEA